MAGPGLSVTDVGATLRIALNGNDDSKYREGNFEYDINIRVDNFDRISSITVKAKLPDDTEEMENIPAI